MHTHNAFAGYYALPAGSVPDLPVVHFVQLGRIETTVVPREQNSSAEAIEPGVAGPMGGQFGQQWDEQQYTPMQPAFDYGNPDVLPQVAALTLAAPPHTVTQLPPPDYQKISHGSLSSCRVKLIVHDSVIDCMREAVSPLCMPETT